MAGLRPRPLVAGNWKMNGTRASLPVLEAVIAGLTPELASRIDVLVCPPATLVGTFAAAAAGTPVRIGGQDVHAAPSGAHTGCIAAEMLADLGATHTIVGHSERRADQHETDAQVCAKALGARRAGLVAIICVGETREEREAGRTLAVVRGQLAGSLPDGATAADTVIAYEPVWAIGTGLTPTAADVAEVHGLIRRELQARLGAEGDRVRILYGGSVKPSNAAELMAVPNVDGALVGGASLKAEDFLGIAAAYA
ncbi:triose-phosphate isomerase [Methylobacterium nodulans]|uniref:Triosephosphate isomerase n=1 Tax=Methylobacterium nodulans (strain LMG 21967 / CNCM I-2342 / ORS 2060) TaxID=460265 RepID=B8IP95_METNO|nr:triose-phosphate isomerase [Methylobacterium nodulans]ACL60413.1 triosephosphate isomerase [Methylobacterium nodulans ORS 2060]